MIINNNQTEHTNFSNSEKIKMAAIKLFSIYGYGSTTVRMIAKEAGLSAGQLTVHYGSKEELYESIIQDAIKISNGKIRSIKFKREQLIEDGTYTKEHIWELIEQMVNDLIDYSFIPYNRACIMMLNISLPNSPIVENANKAFQEVILKQHEIFMAQLLQDYAERKGYLKFRVISRAVNGAIVSFAEHQDFLMSEVYVHDDQENQEAAVTYAKGHLKNFILNSLKNIDHMSDITNVEKY